MRRLAHSELAEYLPDCGGPFPIATESIRPPLCGGGGGGDGGAAEMARQQMEQARTQHLDNMRNLRKQQRVAANAKSPAFNPAAPPMASNEQTLDASTDEQRRARRRFGTQATTGETLGSTQNLGA